MRLSFFLFSVLTTLGLFSCGTQTSPLRNNTSLAAYQAYDTPAYHPQNPSNVRVKVSLSKQLVYVMEGARPLLITPVTIGTSHSPTPTGTFRIFNKEKYHRANTHGFAYKGKHAIAAKLSQKPSGWSFKGTPMPYWCEFKHAYGFHTGWMKPFPASHGCLRIHENVAPKFFALVRVGTPVSIAHSQPEDSTLGRNIPRPPDATPYPDFPPTFMVSDRYFNFHKPIKWAN